jgi:hypothetical protein
MTRARKGCRRTTPMATGQTVTRSLPNYDPCSRSRCAATTSSRLYTPSMTGDGAVQAEGGGAISAADDALGFVGLIEKGDHHRAHVNLAN